MVSGGKHFNGLSVTAICARSITVAVSSRYSRIVAFNDAFAFTRRDLGRLPPTLLAHDTLQYILLAYSPSPYLRLYGIGLPHCSQVRNGMVAAVSSDALDRAAAAHFVLHYFAFSHNAPLLLWGIVSPHVSQYLVFTALPMPF